PRSRTTGSPGRCSRWHSPSPRRGAGGPATGRAAGRSPPPPPPRTPTGAGGRGCAPPDPWVPTSCRERRETRRLRPGTRSCRPRPPTHPRCDQPLHAEEPEVAGHGESDGEERTDEDLGGEVAGQSPEDQGAVSALADQAGDRDQAHHGDGGDADARHH